MAANVTNCRGNGPVVAANNITLNLAGHTVSGRQSAAEAIAILLDHVTRVTVRNGTVTGFDAGVVVRGGSGNTVTAITARNNINDNVPTQSSQLQGCIYGDGIVLEGSDGNTVSGNTVVHNGPYAGISMILDADNNTARNNTVEDHNVANTATGGGAGNCGAPFQRPIQDVGIRIEGPGADGNLVSLNRIVNSAIGGITIHGYVYCPPTTDPLVCGPSQDMNTANVIQYNYVADTGRTTYTEDSPAEGIGVLRQGPATIVGASQGNTIDSNTVVTSHRHGIFLGNPACGNVSGTNPPVTRGQPGPYAGNIVTNNTVHYSLFDGIRCRRARSTTASPATPPSSTASTTATTTTPTATTTSGATTPSTG